MKIAIIDYGMGNLHSVFQSVRAANDMAGGAAEVVLTACPDTVAAADKVVFPGQGAMPDCMAALNRSGLRAALAESLETKPFFGICVGAQLLFSFSEEGDTRGLDWFAGKVRRFPSGLTDSGGGRLKVPHMGWNTVRQQRRHPLFAGIADETRFYFVHSYYFEPDDSALTLAQSDYPQPFSCVVGKDNVFATQFHTEKSHLAGLQMLQNFILWDGQD